MYEVEVMFVDFLSQGLMLQRLWMNLSLLSAAVVLRVVMHN